MQTDLKYITAKPLVILSLFGVLALSTTIVLMTLFHSAKSEAIIYQHIYDELSSINNLKQQSLERYFDDKRADIQALALSRTVTELVQQPKNLQKFQEYFNHYLKEYPYKDILLINMEGKIFVTIHYPQYLGKNLSTQAFEKSDMAMLYKRVKKDKTTHFSDMYTPFLYSADPVMLVATPVFIKGKMHAVLMLKLPSDTVNQVLHARVSRQKTLESYAVGEDYVMRSDSSLRPDLTVKNSFNNSSHYRLHTQNIQRALQGEKGVDLIVNYRGVKVLSAFSPFKIDGHIWALLTEIDEEEINLELLSVKHSIQRWAVFMAIILFVIPGFTS